MGRKSRFSGEVRERAARMVLEHGGRYDLQWAAIRSIAGKIGRSPEALRKWVRQAEIDAGGRGGRTSEERKRMRELEREVFELRRANEILREALAYFAAAELERRPKWERVRSARREPAREPDPHARDDGSELRLVKLPGFELFDAPLMTLCGRSRDGRWRRTQVLDIPFLSVFDQENTDTESWSTHFIGFPILGSVYSRERTSDRDARQLLFLIRV